VRAATRAEKATGSAGPRTLAIDIGGTGLKAMVLDSAGKEVTERVRVPTPRPATPKAILSALAKMLPALGAFDRVSCGFPGVVVEGVTRTAPNLHAAWAGFDLAHALMTLTKRPARAINDAGVQGYGVVKGRGVEMLLTLGTGMGCALFVDGIYVPNLELAHHPFRHGKTYEECVGALALESVGKKKWNRRVSRVLAQIDPIWNPLHIYLGGGNAKHLVIDLPPHVTITSNLAGLLGGIALWGAHERAVHRNDTPAKSPLAPEGAPQGASPRARR
jgi:polyphosphate glucokinase